MRLKLKILFKQPSRRVPLTEIELFECILYSWPLCVFVFLFSKNENWNQCTGVKRGSERLPNTPVTIFVEQNDDEENRLLICKDSAMVCALGQQNLSRR